MQKSQWTYPLGALLVVAIAACGGAPASTASAKPTVVTKVVEVPITPTPSPIPEGGWVVQAITAEPVTLNPVLAADPVSKTILETLYLGLLGPDPHTGELRGEIAERWSFSEQGEQVTFELADDLRWSDGKAITAWDVKFTFEAIVSEHVDSPLRSVLAGVDSLDVLDDQHLTLRLVEPDCTLLANLMFGILPSHRFADDFRDVMEHPENMSPSVSSGPLVFQEWERGQHLKLERNERYMRGAPHIDGIIYRFYPDREEALEAFLAGEVDILELDLSSLSVVEGAIVRGASFEVKRRLSDGYAFLGLNLADPEAPEPGWVDADEDGQFDAGERRNASQPPHPTLGDRLVRRALAHAVNVQDIVNQVMLGEAARTPANVLPSVRWAFNESLASYPFDPVMAMELLDEAGWVDEDDDGWREKEGQRLRVEILVNVENEDRVKIAEMIREDLIWVGFETSLTVDEWPTVLWRQLGQRFDIVVSEWSDLGFQPHDAAFWSYAHDDPLGGMNFVSYYSLAVERAANEISASAGCATDARAEHYREIQRLIYEDVPYVFLFVPYDHLAWNTHLEGLDPGPWSFVHNLEDWYLSPAGEG